MLLVRRLVGWAAHCAVRERPRLDLVLFAVRCQSNGAVAMRPVHWLAECHTCGKVWEDRNAVAVGARHSKAHGHEVSAEVMLSGRWIAGVRR